MIGCERWNDGGHETKKAHDKCHKRRLANKLTIELIYIYIYIYDIIFNARLDLQGTCTTGLALFLLAFVDPSLLTSETLRRGTFRSPPEGPAAQPAVAMLFLVA